MLELETTWPKTSNKKIKIYELNLSNEIEIETLHDEIWLSIDQTKQLIEFLTKQIEGK